jgi:two-component sensor histidine kinase
MKVRITADLAAPQAARDLTRDYLAGESLPRGVPASDIVLVVSELVTNAVQAGASSLQLTLVLSRRGLELVVEDDAGGWPVRTPVPTDAMGGRGLNIVEELCDRWQVAGLPGGKRVTAMWSQAPAQVPT